MNLIFYLKLNLVINSQYKNSYIFILGKFRNLDHNFEWNRKQFQEWCLNITKNYDYSVYFDGIGDPPSEFNIGFCTQIAIFLLKNNENKIVIYVF